MSAHSLNLSFCYHDPVELEARRLPPRYISISPHVTIPPIHEIAIMADDAAGGRTGRPRTRRRAVKR